MREAYSRLAFLLEERDSTRAALWQRVREQGDSIDMKTLNRLADPDRPVKLLDTRVAGAICRALGVDMSELLVFVDSPPPHLATLPTERQQRLDALLERNAEGRIATGEHEELRALVEETGRLSLTNAQTLTEHRRRVRDASASRRHTAAD
ncbi:MAG TPA: helix-turn-helix transcriptional regulator [Thermomicrobiales bacterium]|nr:helix-turn-helix transcriptional regulator [Thermomicrobiales bacterium]